MKMSTYEEQILNMWIHTDTTFCVPYVMWVAYVPNLGTLYMEPHFINFPPTLKYRYPHFIKSHSGGWGM